MSIPFRRLQVGVATAILSCASITSAWADDTEIFVNQANARGVRPNILLVLDTSGSMEAAVAGGKLPFDPTKTYEGSCDRSSYYWRRGGGTPPLCTSTSKVAVAANVCASATRSITGMGGLWTGRLAQWNPAQSQWRNLSATNADEVLECEEDAGVHGSDPASVRRYARNGDTANRWTADADTQIGWASIDVHTLYSANWLNWFHAAPDGVEVSRLQTLQAAASTLAYSISGVNLGLMRFSNNDEDRGGDAAAEGGMVLHPIEDVTTARDAIVDQVNNFTSGGYTPLTETLYEAGQYFKGGPVDYGLLSRTDVRTPFPSVAASRDPSDASKYKSPIEYQCQRNYVVMLTDGKPQSDNGADTKIQALKGSACDGTGDGRCFDDMAEYLATRDQSTKFNGPQNVQTYAVGFGDSVDDWTFLEDAARSGGGKAFVADDIGGLTTAIQEILGEILQRSSTFTTPSVAINALNRTQSMNELFISVFRPEDTLHWPGNLKKYGLKDGKIVDAAGRDAVDPATGFFRQGTKSFWSPTQDDDRADVGGAVSQLPAPDARNIYTFLESPGNQNLTASVNSLSSSNDRLTDELVGAGGSNASREEVINWARGVDTLDQDGDGDHTDTFKFMGDPLHARPAFASYGGSVGSPSAEDAVVFVPTNDGFLHAVDARSGRELWAFIPPELLGRLGDLYRDPVVAARTYGLDGDVRVLRFDANQNGIIEAGAGDKVWIYFGMRRGGRFYYAVDVTDRTRPRLMWKLGPDALPGVGETWSTPAIARVKVGGASQNGESFVLVMGGGYDDAQENYNATPDSSGNRIYMVDAASGRLLWFAGGPDSTGSPDLALSRMTNSIPSRVVVIDNNGDQFADRLYAADTGGRIWRFDISNGASRSSLVAGGVLASLGGADSGDSSIQNARRFYYAPDVALIERRGADPYYNLAIGSGYRGHPLHTGTHDRFYSIRDKNPFGKLTHSQYESLDTIGEEDLVDITSTLGNPSVSTDARGWRVELRLNQGWSGEKVLAEALTAGGVILFPTYQPVAPDASSPCIPNGQNRVYALSVDTGKPAVDFSGDQQITAADASTTLTQTGIAGEVSLMLESQVSSDSNNGDGEAGSDPGGAVGLDGRDALGRRALCMVGVEVLQKCVLPGSVVRSFWQRSAVN